MEVGCGLARVVGRRQAAPCVTPCGLRCRLAVLRSGAGGMGRPCALPLFAGFALVFVDVLLQQLQVALGDRGQRPVGAFDVPQLHMLGAFERD